MNNKDILDIWQIEHKKIIDDFLVFLNNETSDYILKGGTALMTCYNLDRFSEDIDLDGKSKNIEKIIINFCKKYNFSYRIAKDTDVVKRYMINYGVDNRPLKIEISFRRKRINDDEITIINNINTYKINQLCIMKATAYNGRDKIRDLYDLSFICNNYWDQLLDSTISIIRDIVSYKGLEQFDYLLKTQEDNLIDKDKLALDFLTMFERLELLINEDELEIIKNKEIKNNFEI